MQKGIAENKECVYHINVYMYGRDITHVHGCNMVQVAVYPVLQACKFKKKYIIKAQFCGNLYVNKKHRCMSNAVENVLMAKISIKQNP